MRRRTVPIERLRRGELGEPLYVLSVSEIRSVEVLDRQVTFQTADGDVIGRPGDVAITGYGGERWPILRSVFDGAYEILGGLGNRIVARRLIHVRTAWEVLSPDAEFDYGTDRGVVSVKRGGWLYQSDDNDYGLINPSVNQTGHVAVGPIKDVLGFQWWGRLERVGALLTFLPVLLTLLALLSLYASWAMRSDMISKSLTAASTFLLVFGVGCALWMEQNNWRLKAAVSAGVEAARKFQSVVKMLGCSHSEEFPQMALWRAGQQVPVGVSDDKQDLDRDLQYLRSAIAEVSDEIEADIRRNALLERLGEMGQIVMASLVVLINIWLIFSKTSIHVLEVTATWLPSLLGCFHSLTYRKRTADRMSTLREFVDQLKFVKTRLQDGEITEKTPAAASLRIATLQLLCRLIGRYCQDELKIALAQRPSLPIG